jgi:hypothetical protein
MMEYLVVLLLVCAVASFAPLILGTAVGLVVALATGIGAFRIPGIAIPVLLCIGLAKAWRAIFIAIGRAIIARRQIGHPQS